MVEVSTVMNKSLVATSQLLYSQETLSAPWKLRRRSDEDSRALEKRDTVHPIERNYIRNGLDTVRPIKRNYVRRIKNTGQPIRGSIHIGTELKA